MQGHRGWSTISCKYLYKVHREGSTYLRLLYAILLRDPCPWDPRTVEDLRRYNPALLVYPACPRQRGWAVWGHLDLNRLTMQLLDESPNKWIFLEKNTPSINNCAFLKKMSYLCRAGSLLLSHTSIFKAQTSWTAPLEGGCYPVSALFGPSSSGTEVSNLPAYMPR